MQFRVSTCPGISNQSDAQMIVVRRATRIQLDRFAKEVNRRVIFLSFKTGTALLVVMLGSLRRRELRPSGANPRDYLASRRFNLSPRQGTGVAWLPV